MSNPPPPRQKVFSSQQGAYKNVDVGKKVLLDDSYLVENNKSMQMEAVFIRTIQNAEAAAQEIVEQAREEAQLILDAAREKALQIVTEEGENLRDGIVQQAFAEGYQAGLEKGFGQIAEELAEKVMMADTIVQKAFEAQAVLIDQHRRQLLRVIETIVGLVLPYEIQSNPAQLTGLIEKASEAIYHSGEARIRLHPETLRAMQDFSPEVLKTLETVEKLVFVADMNCLPLEMILETADSSTLISAKSQAEVYLKHISKTLQFEEGDPNLLEATELIAELQTEGHDDMGPKPQFVSPSNPRQLAPEETATEASEEEDALLMLDEDEQPEEEATAPQTSLTPNDEVLMKFLDKTDTDVPE